MEKVLFNEIQISKALEKMAKKIDEYIMSLPELTRNGVIIVGLLNGCIHFVSDLTRKIKSDHKLAFVRASSYINNKQGNLSISGDIPDFSNSHVIILDDICDTGKTLKRVVEIVNEDNPLSVKTGVLLNKKIPNKEFEVDYKAFDIDDVFVYGYGLDYDEYKRNLPDIRILV